MENVFENMWDPSLLWRSFSSVPHPADNAKHYERREQQIVDQFKCLYNSCSSHSSNVGCTWHERNVSVSIFKPDFKPEQAGQRQALERHVGLQQTAQPGTLQAGLSLYPLHRSRTTFPPSQASSLLSFVAMEPHCL